MYFPPEAEQLLQDTIFPELERGRPNYDKPHTIGVVAKVRDLIKHNPKLQLDAAILVIVGYAHDWGYAELFKDGEDNFEGVKAMKKEHMRIGAQKIRELLKDPTFSFLSDQQKQRIIHLVGIHDRINELKDTDELIFMEADTLGALDSHYVTPTFDKESNDAYMRGPLLRRLSLFITDYGKKEAKRLVRLREAYYQRM